MRILITGGSGFIGANLIHQIAKENDVVSLSYPNENHVPCTQYSHDIRHFSTMIRDGFIPSFDSVVHLAHFRLPPKSFDRKVYWEKNLDDPQELFSVLAKKGCKKFIYASTVNVYEDSDLQTEDTKVNCLHYEDTIKSALDIMMMDFASRHQVDVIGLRFSNVYGPFENYKKSYQSDVRKIIQELSNGKFPQVVWDGTQTRDWIFIDDAVQGIVKSLNIKDVGGTILNIASGQASNYIHLCSLLTKQTGTRNKIQWIPNSEPNRVRCTQNVCIDKATRLIGFDPKFSIDEGIQEYFRRWT